MGAIVEHDMKRASSGVTPDANTTDLLRRPGMSEPQNTAPVEYRPIEGFMGYRVGNDGSVWSCWKRNGRHPRYLCDDWKRLKPTPDGDGYLAVPLYCGGKPYRRKVHLLVLVAFRSERPDGLEGCHDNGDVTNCCLSNLRWDTHSSNIRDRLRHGTDSRGEKNGNARLKKSMVLAIKAAIARGERQADIAAQFQIATSTVSSIKCGRLWSWA
jgi:hypothetical protein